MNKILAFLLSPFRVVFSDLKGDLVFIKQCFTNMNEGKPMVSNEKIENLKKGLTTEWDDFFKKMWWIFILMIGFFFAGYFLAAKVYQNECNQLLYDYGYIAWNSSKVALQNISINYSL